MTIKPRPRRWQVEALSKWKEQYAGIAKVVTGGGKTVFALLCIEQFQKKYPNGPALIVVPTLALADQWYVTLQDDGTVNAREIAVFSGIEKGESIKPYNIVVLNTARDILPKFKSASLCLLVVDECHRIGSEQSLPILGLPWLSTLGLSATPERQSDEAFVTHLVPKLGPVIADYDYKAAHEDGVISDFRLINVLVPLNAIEEKEYNQLSQRVFAAMRRAENGSESSQEALKLLLIRRARIASSAVARVPVAVKIALQDRAAKQIIFHEDIRGANAMLTLLNSLGLYALGYHTKIGASLRRSNLSLFKQGISNVLCSCHALDEGLNVPDISVGIIASSTASRRQRIQRLGRVLRPSVGKKEARIYTLYSTKAEEQRLREEQTTLGDITEVEWMRIRN